MNENINLCEILKDCPRDTELWSPMLGVVKFKAIKTGKILVYQQKKEYYGSFEKDGKFLWGYNFATTECMLFPSEEQRDWSKWKCPKPKKPKFSPKTLKAFDRVLVRGQVGSWSPALFTYLCDVPPRKELMMDNLVAKYVIPYNDDTKHLVGTSDEAPEYYRYWEV